MDSSWSFTAHFLSLTTRSLRVPSQSHRNSNTAAMNNEINAEWVIAYTMWILLQLLSAPHALYVSPPSEENDDINPFQDVLTNLGEPVDDGSAQMHAALQNFRLCTSLNVFDDDLGYWVKPRSTTWFSRFLLSEYDDSRWIQMFRMNKAAVFALVDLLRPHVMKKDTKYRLAIPVVIRVACCLFKLAHGASLFVCSEIFAIGKSTVSSILRQVVHAINDTLQHELKWPSGDRLRETQELFYDLCGLPAVVGAIDGIHISISKPLHGPADYFHYKSGAYTLNCQAVVDSQKRFLDLYLGMPGSTNDSRMLRRSTLYDLATHQNLMGDEHAIHGFSPYLIGDSGYPLLPWLMIPHRNGVQLSVAERLFNKKLRKGRCVVENAFGILKQTFRELLTKSELHVSFFPDVILACAILHNILLGQSHEQVQNLLEVLRNEGLHGEVLDENEVVENDGDGTIEHTIDAVTDEVVLVASTQKRSDLGAYLTMQRVHPM